MDYTRIFLLSERLQEYILVRRLPAPTCGAAGHLQRGRGGCRHPFIDMADTLITLTRCFDCNEQDTPARRQTHDSANEHTPKLNR